MSKLDSTESQDLSNSPKPQAANPAVAGDGPKKSAAASRILRAVEMGRTSAAPKAETSGVPDSAESLKSLSAATQESVQPEPAPAKVSATMAGLAAAAKIAAAEGNAQASSATQAIRGRAEEPVKQADASPGPLSGVISPNSGFWATLSTAAKAGLIVAILVATAGLVYFFSKSSEARATATAQATPQVVPMTGAGGWNTKWAGEPGRAAGRSISLFRPSQPLANYRIEFDGQIESKGLGWVFRARDPRNYYAYKLEVVKPGLQQLVALVRIAMIDGLEAERHYTPLKSPVSPSHSFHIRMDANGSEFTTWIGDQLVEAWRDNRLQTGGIGLLQDTDERAQIHKVQIFEMR